MLLHLTSIEKRALLFVGILLVLGVIGLAVF